MRDEKSLTAEAQLELAVGTFNIHHGEGADGNLDLERIGAVIASAGLDVAGLQEVDQNFGARSLWLDEVSEIARRTSRFVAYGPAISKRGRAYGNAIISKQFIIRSEAHLFRGWPAREPRGFVHALVGTWPRPVHAISTHLGLTEAERASQARQLVGYLRTLTGPVILFGDFNERPDGPAVAAVRQVFASATPVEVPTFRLGGGSVPDAQIDYIFFSPHFRVTSARAVDGPASDHSAFTALVILDPGRPTGEAVSSGSARTLPSKAPSSLEPIP